VTAVEIASLVQFDSDGSRGVAGIGSDGRAYLLAGAASTLDLARQAVAERCSLGALAARRAGASIDLARVSLITAIDHPDPAHLTVSGTGLTHLGSA